MNDTKLEESRAVSVTKNDSLVAILTPRSLNEAVEFSKLIARSDLAPKDFKGKPENVLIAMQMGAEVGLSPMQAIQNIAVINGRPSVWGDAALAIVQASGKMEWIKEELKGSGEELVAYCQSKRLGYPEPKTTSFSVADAKRAGLWGKAIWQNYSKRMLQMRARGFNIRDNFADVMRGLNIAEEMQDIIEVAVEPVEDLMPQRASQSKAAAPVAEAPPAAEKPKAAQPPTQEPPAQEAPPFIDAQFEEPPADFGGGPPPHREPAPTPQATLGGNNIISDAQRRRLFGLASKGGKKHSDIKDYLFENFDTASTNEIKCKDYDAICAWAEGREPGQEG